MNFNNTNIKNMRLVQNSHLKLHMRVRNTQVHFVVKNQLKSRFLHYLCKPGKQSGIRVQGLL